MPSLFIAIFVSYLSLNMAITIRKKKLANDTMALYLDIYVQGTRRRQHLNLFLTKDRNQNREAMRIAETLRAQKELELAALPTGLAPTFKRRGNFIQFFEELAASKNRTWMTVLIYLKDFAGESVSFESIDKTWLERFQDHLTVEVSENSASTYYNKICAALEIATNDGIYPRNPSKGARKLKQRPAERVFLTIDEIRLLAATPCDDETVKQAFLFSCFSGLRLSDVSRLRWSQVHGNQIHFTQKKTGAQEYLPLSPAALNIIASQPKKGTLIFEMSPSSWYIWNVVTRWSKSAGIGKHISFHNSRHTFATLALTNNVDIYTVSKLLGHTDIRNTQIYAKVIDKRKQEAVNLLPNL